MLNPKVVVVAPFEQFVMVHMPEEPGFGNLRFAFHNSSSSCSRSLREYSRRLLWRWPSVLNAFLALWRRLLGTLDFFILLLGDGFEVHHQFVPHGFVEFF